MSFSLVLKNKTWGTPARQRPLAIGEIPHEMNEADAVAVLNRTFSFVHDYNSQPSIVQFMPDGSVRRIALKELREMLANRRVRLSSNDDQPKCESAWKIDPQLGDIGVEK